MAITLYALKPRFQALLRPLVGALAGAGVTANQVTLAAAGGSVALGLALALWAPAQPAWFLLVPAWLALRMALNAVDGMLAREFDQKSRLGACLNELGDVVSDAALYLPFALLGAFEPAWVVLVVVLAVIGELAGVLGPTIGASRRYDGPLGKSDRALAFGAIGLWAGLAPLPDWLAWAMPVLAVLAALTIVNRVRGALAGRGARVTGMLESMAASLVTGFARLVTGVRGDWRDSAPDPAPRIYFANHASHGDFVLVWTVLPRALRRLTRPVAGADYWNQGAIRRFLGQRVFRAVLIDRRPEMRHEDPLAPMAAAIDQGQSLILFPEGTRNLTDERLLPFKSGLYHLARMRPAAAPVPVWIENLNRVMPKGELVPIPLLCTVTFGAPLPVAEGEDKAAYLARAQAALLALAPKPETTP